VTIFIYLLTGGAFFYSLYRDREKSKRALRVGARVFLGMLPSILLVVGLVGLVMGLLPPEVISYYIGPGTGFAGTLVAALAGAVTLIPSIVSFPLAASLVSLGASIGTIAAFITTLTMVGIVTAPIEIKELGLRFTLWRNGLSFLAAILIALTMGVVLI